MYRSLSEARNKPSETELDEDVRMVCIGFRIAGNVTGDSSSRLIIEGDWDAQIMGGLEETGRDSVVNVDVVERLITLKHELDKW